MYTEAQITETVHRISLLIAEGYADEKRVAYFINTEDAAGLRSYLNEARRRRNVAIWEKEQRQMDADTVSMCRRWVRKAIESKNGNIGAAKQQVGKLKDIAERMGIIEHLREAWIEETKTTTK